MDQLYLADPRIQALLTALRGVPAIFNAERERQALGAARGLADSGYFENVGTAPQSAASGIEGASPNITYTLALGPQGRLYRQAFMDTTGAFASRGNLFGTDRERSERQGKQRLDADVNRQTFELGNVMSRSLSEQGERITGINREQADIKFDIGEREAARQRAAAENAPPAAAAAPTPGGTIIYTGRAAPNPNTIQQRHRGFTWFTRPRAGGGYEAVLGSYAPAAWTAIEQAHGRSGVL